MSSKWLSDLFPRAIHGHRHARGHGGHLRRISNLFVPALRLVQLISAPQRRSHLSSLPAASAARPTKIIFFKSTTCQADLDGEYFCDSISFLARGVIHLKIKINRLDARHIQQSCPPDNIDPSPHSQFFQTRSASRQGIQSQNPRSRCTVREISTGTPSIFRASREKYFRFAMFASVTRLGAYRMSAPAARGPPLLGDIFDRYVKSQRVLLKPPQAGVRSRPSVFVLAEARKSCRHRSLCLLVAQQQ